jgi:hypothetical protein
VHDRDVGLGRRSERRPYGCGARRAARYSIWSLLESRRDCDHYAVTHGLEHVEAPIEQRTAAAQGERLGPGGAKAFATAGGGNDPDDGHAGVVY